MMLPQLVSNAGIRSNPEGMMCTEARKHPLQEDMEGQKHENSGSYDVVVVKSVSAIGKC